MFFTIPNFLERMLQEPLSPLTALSISAIITTISLFFCGIPICMEIYRRRSTSEISGFPFLMGFLGGAFWLRYGLIKSDLTMVTVNVVGVSLMSLYLLFYLYFSRPRTCFLLQMVLVCAIIGAMVALVHFYYPRSEEDFPHQALGFVCMTFNIVNFGAPLAGLRVVLRNRSCATLPLPLCIANLLVSSQWCLYGVCVRDVYIITPNGAGVLLALLQISLFLVFPRRQGAKAPLARCCAIVDELVDVERGEDDRRRLRGDKRVVPSAHGHSASARQNRFLNRQRVVDRRMIPASRAACIEFLRSNAFDASFGSVNSRTTEDSALGASSLSRLSNLSASHPELWDASVEWAFGPGGDCPLHGQQQTGVGDTFGTARLLQPSDGSEAIGQQQFTFSGSTVIGPSTSLLSSQQVSSACCCPDCPATLLSSRLAPVEEDEQPLVAVVRTLSAPDLAAAVQMQADDGASSSKRS